jgi:hypothetical protein
MIIWKPEKAEDLYPLFEQMLIAKHKPDPDAGWGIVTFTGRGFYLRLEGDYKTDYKRRPIDIEHPDSYFCKKFAMHTDDNEIVYMDRYIKMSFCKDMKGCKKEWATFIYQHEQEPTK